MSSVAMRVLVSGRVQGVAFRWHTRDAARALGLVGWVRNLADGRVEVHAQGDEEQLAALAAFLEQGPPAALVTGIERKPAEVEEASAFDIVR